MEEKQIFNYSAKNFTDNKRQYFVHAANRTTLFKSRGNLKDTFKKSRGSQRVEKNYFLSVNPFKNILFLFQELPHLTRKNFYGINIVIPLILIVFDI